MSEHSKAKDPVVDKVPVDAITESSLERELLAEITKTIPLYTRSEGDEEVNMESRLAGLFSDYYTLVVKEGRHDSGHGRDHVGAVVNNALYLAQLLEIERESRKMVFLAAWMHDMVRAPNEGFEHSIRSAEKAKELLQGLSPADRDLILKAIRNHSINYRLSLIFGNLPENLNLKEYREKVKEFKIEDIYSKAQELPTDGSDVEFIIHAADFLDRLGPQRIWIRLLHILAQERWREPEKFLDCWSLKFRSRDFVVFYHSPFGDKLRGLLSKDPEKFDEIEEGIKSLGSYVEALGNKRYFNPQTKKTFLEEEFERGMAAWRANIAPLELQKQAKEEFPERFTRYGIPQKIARCWF